MNFIEAYEKMTTSEKNTFRDVANNLLYQCFITKMKFDKNTTTDKINNDYSFIEKHYSVFEDYLSYMDVVLNKDDNQGVIYCSSVASKNRLRIDSATTLLVYALRSYYEDSLSENPNSQKVYVASTTLKIHLKNLGLSTTTKKLTNQQLATSLRLLSNYNIVMKCEHNFYDNYFSFFILPPIRYVINTEKMNILYDKLTNPEGSDQDFDSEDSGMFSSDYYSEGEGE